MGGAPGDRQGTRPAGGQGLQEASRGDSQSHLSVEEGAGCAGGRLLDRASGGLGYVQSLAKSPGNRAGPSLGIIAGPGSSGPGPYPAEHVQVKPFGRSACTPVVWSGVGRGTREPVRGSQP